MDRSRFHSLTDSRIVGRLELEAAPAEVQRVAGAIAAADTLFVTVDPNVDPNAVRYERLARAAIEALRSHPS